jgi:hypothetical protein
MGILGLMLLSAQGISGEKKKTTQETPAKEVVVNGELNNADLKDKVRTESYCKSYTFKMTAGRTYKIDMVSKDLDSFLRVENAKGEEVASDDDSGGNLNARIIYRAPKTEDFQIIATSLAGGEGKFNLTVKDITAGDVKVEKGNVPGGAAKAIELKNEKGKANHNGNLAANDAKFQNKTHKLFLFNMEAGKTYQIDMKSKALDSYLFLEDPNGVGLAQDDDSGGFPDARITHKATVTGKHRILATHFGANGVGDFTLTIEQIGGGEQPKEEKKEEKKR